MLKSKKITGKEIKKIHKAFHGLKIHFCSMCGAPHPRALHA